MATAATSPPPNYLAARGQVAALSRSRTPNDPVLVTARERLREARLRRSIARALAEAEPLPADVLDRIADLLRPIPAAE